MESKGQSKLLVVDDDRKLAGLIRDYLTPMGYEVELRHNAPDGLAEALATPYQAVILDVMGRVWKMGKMESVCKS